MERIVGDLDQEVMEVSDNLLVWRETCWQRCCAQESSPAGHPSLNREFAQSARQPSMRNRPPPPPAEPTKGFARSWLKRWSSCRVRRKRWEDERGRLGSLGQRATVESGFFKPSCTQSICAVICHDRRLQCKGASRTTNNGQRTLVSNKCAGCHADWVRSLGPCVRE